MRLSAPAAQFSLAATFGVWSAGSGQAGTCLRGIAAEEGGDRIHQVHDGSGENTVLLRKGFMELPAR
jgi:hypothetical protein